MSLVYTIWLPGEVHLWWADGLHRSLAANHFVACPPGTDGKRFPTSFLISARAPWALIHESCSDILLMYAALISLTLQGVKRLGDATGILMLDANLCGRLHCKERCGRSKETLITHSNILLCVSCFVSLKSFWPMQWFKSWWVFSGCCIQFTLTVNYKAKLHNAIHYYFALQ